MNDKFAVALLFQIVVLTAVNAETWGNNLYRIEVILLRFDNSDGVIANGKRCDVATDCDPRIFAAFDLDTPNATYPGSAKLNQFQLTWKGTNRNIVNMHTRIIKNICDRQHFPEQVTVRVMIKDYDTFTVSDLIENFDCTFEFVPTSRDAVQWSDDRMLRSCQAIQQPGRIKLFYKSRIIPIHSGECDITGLVDLTTKSLTTKNTTKSTTITTTTSTHHRSH